MASKNIGKDFESRIQKYIPDYAKMFRLPDAAQSFGGSNNLRFSRKNPFDYFLWDSSRHYLYALELKTVSGKSISFERTEDDKGEIHYHQICGLNEWDKYDGTICGFIIEFRECQKTIFINIKDFNNLISCVDKKSFNLKDIEKYNINYVVIPQKLLKTKYSYDMDYFIKNTFLN